MIEDLYRLSPLQEGMLFESLYAPEGDAYVVQVSWTLGGDLDREALRRAWEHIVERHAVLRTSFHWQETEHPHQVVQRRVELPWVEEDWRGLAPAEGEERLAKRREAERRAGFDLETAPLFRLLLVRHADDLWTLIWTQHHLLLDGWSVSQVLRELFAVYSALCRGEDPRLPPARPFRDYIDWLRRRDPGEAEAFWRRELAGFAAPTPVGSAGDRHAFGGHGRVDVLLDAGDTAALSELARRHRLTLNTFVQGIWALHLARRSGEEDVVFGVVVSGRPAAELPGVETAVGPFINTIPLRARLSPGEPLLSWLAALQQRQLEARSFEHSPLVEVQGWSDVPRDRPLFESLLAFEGSLYEPALAAGAEGVRILDARSNQVSRAPLTLTAAPDSDKLLLSLIYDRGRFEAPEIQRWSGHLVALLRSMAAAPESALAELGYLTAAEVQQVVVEWPSPPTPLPPPLSPSPGEGRPLPATLHGLFLAQAEQAPAAAALVWEGERISYGELAERSGRLAAVLRERGVGPEVRVGISLPRSPRMIEAVLAVLQAGGAYVPLDPDDPPERREWIAADCGAALVLDEDGWGRPSPGEGDRGGGRGVGGEGLAYVLYTSGTTGRPKGVMIPHAAAVNNLLWAQSTYQLAPGDAGLFKTSIGFDVSVRELFWPLSVGARVVIAKPGGERDPGYLIDLIEREGVTVASFVPSLLSAILDTGRPLPLRRVIAGAETLSEDLAERVFRRVPQASLHNHYGPTETAVNATMWRCRPGERPVPIGRAIANVRVDLLDAWGSPVPVGVPGEAHIGGAGVGRGYLGRPDLTAERFVPAPNARLYRTGDLARWRPDGALEFLGRIDHQVKVRGYRVEPEEIEAALAACPGVREAAIVVRDGALVAYVLGAEAGPLRAALAERLPAFLIPSAIVTVDALPRTASGKVDRRALARQEIATLSEGFELPRTPVEEQVAEIWSGVLGRPRIGAHDDFFALGGHSLLALQVVSRVREAFGVEVPLRRLFEAPTPAALAREVEAALQAGTGSPAPPLVAIPSELRPAAIPLSFSQESLWLIHQLDPASPAYNVPAAVVISGRLAPAALARTLAEIVRRHEALRTSFPMIAGRPAQAVHPAAPIPLPEIDLECLPETLKDAEARRLARGEALRPFDLARGPLLRAALARLGEREHLFLLTLHHAISDEWSVAVLVREVGAIYPALAAGHASPLPPLPIQVADHALWQRSWLRGEALEARLRWWKERLVDAPPVIDLPLDRPRTVERSFRGGRVPLEIPAPTLERLRRLARERSASLFMVLLAAVQVWLSRHGAGEDLVIGAPVANRSHTGTEGLIGFFVNTLPLRADLSGEPGFGELVERARETALGAFAHQDLPFERLVQELRPERSLAHAPLFQVMLALHTVPAPALELPGLSFRGLEIDPGTAKVDLVLEMKEGEGGWLEYAADLFDRATAARLAGHLRVLLESAVEDPEMPFSELPILTPAESRQIAEGSAVRAVFPTACLHHLFEAQAAERPGAIAVEPLTYAELDRQANRLARRLLRLGVGPEARVILRHERTPGLIVALLGILKAGGAYVPVDPAWPEERQQLLFEDAGATVIVDEELLATSSEESDASVTDPVRPDNLAYVIYTSGSTGRPKGTLVTHANAARLLAATDAWFGFGPDDVWTLFHSIAFDFSVWEIWGALAYGGRIVVVSEDVRRSPEELRDLLDAEGVTVLNQTPSAFRQLAQSPPPESLRTVIFGGEALDVSMLANWPGVRAVNMYGITETTVHVTYRPLTREDLGSPIGIAIPDLSIHVLDRHGAPVPIGVPGELYVGGAGVARGYLNRPDLTAERFVPDLAGSRLYRSGDLARWLPSGELEYLGRIDQQVKLRGFRIEPAEIESALRDVAGVAEAAVLLRDDLPGGPGLVAYVVSGLSSGDLLAALRSHLPDPMVPGHFVFLPALPVTPNGKLDRRALPAPEGGRPDLARAYVAPCTPLERVLAGAWEEALGVDRVGVEDGFFDLGGHSLLATQVISWVRETFEVNVPLRELFERPTVAGLAAALTADAAVRSQVERTAELLLELSELSEEEVAGRAQGAER